MLIRRLLLLASSAFWAAVGLSVARPRRSLQRSGLPPDHNGGIQEHLVPPKAGKKPHILMILWDDFGWAQAGWHRNYTMRGVKVDPSPEVKTEALDALVREGIELNRAYVFPYCSPTRSALQSGRHPHNVNVVNADVDNSNPEDPVSGFAGIPRNMTGIATKMAAAGYRTAMFGKWDAGMATPDHTPDGRGYQSGLWYYAHSNNYWSMSSFLRCGGQSPADLWVKAEMDCQSVGAFGYNNSCPAAGLRTVGAVPTSCKVGAKGDKWYGGYEDAVFEQELLNLIESHDPQVPLFVFWAPHAIHGPFQVPESVIREFDFMSESDTWTENRQLINAMVMFADRAVGNVTDALKTKGMWDDTLVVFMSDNGGDIFNAGNNYPLTGGKFSQWEGGIRSNAFVSGGFLPNSRRGFKYNGLVTAWDWYATFSALAGVDSTDKRAALAGLPAVDSLDMSDFLLGRSWISPRAEVPLGSPPVSADLATRSCLTFSKPRLYDHSFRELPTEGNCTLVVGIISDEEDGLWKLLMGNQIQYASQGPTYPNASGESHPSQMELECGHGCLFELTTDPFEREDLSQNMPEKVEALRARVAVYAASNFYPNRGISNPAFCEYALNKYGGFLGPFIDVESASCNGRDGQLDPRST